MRDDTNSRIRVVNLNSGEVDEYGLTRNALLNAREEALYRLVQKKQLMPSLVLDCAEDFFF